MSDGKISLSRDYGDLLSEVKARVRAAQYEALRAVNKELVGLYWADDCGAAGGGRLGQVCGEAAC